MDRVKQLIGITAGLFCTLVVAELCSFACNPDFIWLNSLVKPTYVPPGWVFTLLVGMTYISTIWVISRLVVGRHFFPSMIIFCVLGVCCVLFVYIFFTKKMIFASLIFITGILVCSAALTVRFLLKDPKTALIYLPALLFNCYAFVTVCAIAMYN